MASLCPVCTIKWVLIITHIMARFRRSLRLEFGLSNKQQKLQCNARLSSLLISSFYLAALLSLARYVYFAAITTLTAQERALLADMHNVQYGLNEQKCQDLAFFCHGRPYHASTASGVAETTHGCKTQEWQQTLVWLESAFSKYQ